MAGVVARQEIFAAGVFIRLVGIDYERLKFIEIALFCGFLWMFHELIRVRAHRPRKAHDVKPIAAPSEIARHVPTAGQSQTRARLLERAPPALKD